MSAKFLLVTDRADNNQVIIGISNIASIKPDSKGAAITFNFARNNDMWPKKISVSESFEVISKALQDLTVDLSENTGSDF